MAVAQRRNQPFYRVSPFLYLMVILGGLILYINVVHNPFIDDGIQLVIINPQVSISASGLDRIWLEPTPSHLPQRHQYRPILAHFIRAQWTVWGNSPSSFHATNLMLLVGCLVLYLLFIRHLIDHPGALAMAGLVFALHPMGSQTIHSVAGQGILLSLLGVLLGCLVMFWHRQGRLGLAFTAALMTFSSLLALGSHELGWVLPIWLIVLAALSHAEKGGVDKAAERAGKRSRKKTRITPEETDETQARRYRWQSISAISVPLLMVAVGCLWLRAKALGGLIPPEETVIGIADYSPWRYGPAVLIQYLGRLAWPVDPTLIYPIPDSVAGLPPMAAGWAVLFLWMIAIIACWRYWPVMAAGLVMLLTPLIALSHWIPLTFFMSEEPLFYALPGLGLVLGAVVQKLTAPEPVFPPVGWRSRTALVLMVMIWAALAWHSYERSPLWKDPVRLWNAEHQLHPDEAVPLIELTRVYLRNDKYEEALEVINQARMLANDSELDVLVRLEALLYVQQQNTDALRQLLDSELETASAHQPRHFSRLADLARAANLQELTEELLLRQVEAEPDSFDALYELAQINLNRRDLETAYNFAKEAARLAEGGNRAPTYALYGEILAEGGVTTEAIEFLRTAIELEPSLYRPYVYLARIHWGLKQYEFAEDAITRGILNANVSSYVDLAKLYYSIMAEQGREAEALAWLRQATAQYPADDEVRMFAARQHLRAGEYAQAQRFYRQLLNSSVVPLDEVYFELGQVAWFGQRNREVAMESMRRALQINPRHEDAQRYLQGMQAYQESLPSEPLQDLDEAESAIVTQESPTTPTINSQ